MRTASLIIALSTLLSLAPAASAAVTTFDDIEYWIGSGAKRAALAIDWDGNSATDESLVWGFRWDGAATGFDMLRAVAVADARLYAKLRTPDAQGWGVLGLGYDANDDGAFSLSDGTEFDADGIAIVEASNETVAAGPGDAYGEGWLLTIWSYGVTDASPWSSGWFRAPFDPSSRSLVDGSWDSWAYMKPYLARVTVFAANPIAAAPPVSGDSADFDGDGDRDGADFLAWQRGVALVTGAGRADGDANGDEAVDGLDLAVWESQFGLAAVATNATAAAVPEPASVALATWIIFALSRYLFLHRRRSA